jgi:hypothetical protein
LSKRKPSSWTSFLFIKDKENNKLAFFA